MNSSFPSLVEIVLSAGVGGGTSRSLTNDQSRAQSELRKSFPMDHQAPFGAICLPWYETRSGSAMSATGTTSATGDQGGMTIATDVPEIGATFRDALVLEKLGARVFGGLRGNINLPSSQVGLSADWLSENATANQGGDLFNQLALTPSRLTVYLDVSDQLVKEQPQAEAFLRAELMAALAVQCQQVAINGSGSSNQPLGILNTSGIGSVVGGTNGAAPTYQNIANLEYAVTGTAKADRGNVGWLVSPYTRRKLRVTPMFSSGSSPIWAETEAYSLLGHPAGVTPSVPDNLTKGTASGTCSAILCGEFSELFLAFWGAGIFVSAARSISYATAGKTLLTATAYFGCGLRIPTAFAAMSDALCA